MLGNFFTTPEMNDGIATITRVEELVCEIKKLKDCVSSNLHDALKQWSAVAGTLAVTENKECLNHFVQLNGLNFLNQWFQEAQKCSTDIGDNFSEELINSLLKSLERLPLDDERRVFCFPCCWIGLLQLMQFTDQSKAQSLSFSNKEASESDSDSKDLVRLILMTMKRLELDHINISSEALEAKATESSEKKLKLDTDYEDIDALEVARQVAIEVEKEVVDYREAYAVS
ncbi:hypothetical protein ACMD2_19098 [Ananas comosus]|uniref:Uncharacterized protein n=1 Tax=Ananas comosus TaxID=4615 RepID=A0A199UID4_ANACO|nr:hypothetical protein ACMD2_19098 [Ananas comosus]